MFDLLACHPGNVYLFTWDLVPKMGRNPVLLALCKLIIVLHFVGMTRSRLSLHAVLAREGLNFPEAGVVPQM